MHFISFDIAMRLTDDHRQRLMADAQRHRRRRRRPRPRPPVDHLPGSSGGPAAA